VFATIPTENGTEMTKILEVGEFYCFSRDVTPERGGFLLLVVAAAGLCPGPSIFFDILFQNSLILSLNNYSMIVSTFERPNIEINRFQYKRTPILPETTVL
jgi:hypothetical protein